MLLTLSRLKKDKFSWIRKWKYVRFSLLFTITLFLTSFGSQVLADPPTTADPATGGGGGCIGWLCGPKNSIKTGFPGNTSVIDAGFILMQAVVMAILAGIAAITINKIASREDYGAPMASFFGALLVLLVTNYLGGYLFGIR